MYMLQGFVPALRHLESCLEGQDKEPVLPPPPDPLLAHRFSRRTSPASRTSQMPVHCNQCIYFLSHKWLWPKPKDQVFCSARVKYTYWPR